MQEVKQKLASQEGLPTDKLRLALLYLLVSDKMPPESDIDQMSAALVEAGADTAAFQYVVRMKQMNLTGDMAHKGGAASSAGASGWGLPGLVDSSLVSGIAGQFGKHLNKLMGGTRQVWQLVLCMYGAG